jgi:hypothetical protein
VGRAARCALALTWAAFIAVRIDGAQAIPIGGIEGGMGNDSYQKFISGWKATGVYTKAEFGSVPNCASKDIVVLNPSPQIPSRVGDDLFEFVFSHTDRRRMQFAIRPDQSVTKQLGIWKIELRKNGVSESLARHICNYVRCWCLSAVCENSGERVSVDSSINRTESTHLWRVSMSRYADIPCCNVSSQLLFGCCDGNLIGSNSRISGALREPLS